MTSDKPIRTDGQSSIVTDAIAPAHHVVRLLGDHDVATAHGIRDALIAAIPPRDGHLTLDLSACTFLDSSVLGAIVTGAKHASDAGIAFVVAGASPSIARVFQIVGFDRSLTMISGIPQQPQL